MMGPVALFVERRGEERMRGQSHQIARQSKEKTCAGGAVSEGQGKVGTGNALIW